MIDRSLIWLGLLKNIVNLVVDPNLEAGLVCKIGECWFYFGGQKAEEMSDPELYLKRYGINHVADEIYEALKGLEDLNPEEVAYYAAYLREAIRKPA